MNPKLNDKNMKKYVEMFNNDFNTKIKMKHTPFLLNMFENFISQFTSSANDRRDIIKRAKLHKQIADRLDQDTKKLFDEWNILQEKFFLDIINQSFVYGYCVTKQIDEETKIKN